MCCVYCICNYSTKYTMHMFYIVLLYIYTYILAVTARIYGAHSLVFFIENSKNTRVAFLSISRNTKDV